MAAPAEQQLSPLWVHSPHGLVSARSSIFGQIYECEPGPGRLYPPVAVMDGQTAAVSMWCWEVGLAPAARGGGECGAMQASHFLPRTRCQWPPPPVHPPSPPPLSLQLRLQHISMITFQQKKKIEKKSRAVPPPPPLPPELNMASRLHHWDNKWLTDWSLSHSAAVHAACADADFPPERGNPLEIRD